MSEGKNVKRISPGDRFGNLTILCDTGERKYHCTVWRCRCELCGNEADFISRDFFRRGITDCGCQTPIRHIEKIKPGDQFDLLTVLSDSGQRKGSVILWSCRCRCGNEMVADTNALRSGKITDCGCVSSLKKNLMGQQFGKLTVIGDAGVHPKTGDHIWQCRCACGKERLATSSHLTHGLVKSCGCLHDSVGLENLKLVNGTSVTKLEARRRDSDKLSAANTSGYNGVYPQNSHGRKTGRWVAQIGFKGRKYYLGSYAKVEDAVKARKRGEEMYDNFLEWYYDEYLPGMKETTARGSAAAEQRITDAGQAAERPRI